MMTRVAATLGAVLLLCSVQSPSAQESRLEPRPTSDLPERYSRQVAPMPGAQIDRTLVIDPNKRYALPELIDLAQRGNPETRVAWEATGWLPWSGRSAPTSTRLSGT
jgi:hypothetical protein